MIIRFVFTSMVLYFLTCFNAISQYRYSKTDLAAIYNKRYLEKNIHKYDYHPDWLNSIGDFHQRIYLKYKDTSFKSAIRCYEKMLTFEDPFYKDQIPQAAFNLAVIYEKGLGVPIDLYKALAYFYKSQSVGLKAFNRIKEKIGPFEKISYFPQNGNNKIDSLILSFSPHCEWTNNALGNALDRLATFLIKNPTLSVKGNFTGALSPSDIDYIVEINQTSLPVKFNQVIDYLVDKHGIDRSRIINIDYFGWHNKSFYSLTLKVISSEEATKLLSPVVLNGVYMYKDDHCSSSFLFKPNGEFYYESGCEERSNIAKGQYQVNRKIITLHTTAVPLQYNFYKESNQLSKEITLTITDNEGKPLPFFNVFTLPYKIYGDTLENIVHQQTNINGQIIIDTSSISSISFSRTDPKKIFMNKDNVYNWEPISNFNADKITVRFNYSIFCLRYPEIGVTDFVPELVLTNNETELIDNKFNFYKKSQK